MLNRWWALLLLLSGTFSYAGKPVPKAQELFIPYWTSEPGWNTELQLRNNLPSTSLTVTPILRMASGQEIPLAPMTIPANDSISLLVSKAVREQAPDLLGRAGSYGSVVFRYTSAEAMALHARAIVMLEGHPIAVPIHAHTMLQAVAKSDGKEAASMEGIWWQPRAGLSDFLVISNSSEQKANGNLSLFDANGKGWTWPSFSVRIRLNAYHSAICCKNPD